MQIAITMGKKIATDCTNDCRKPTASACFGLMDAVDIQLKNMQPWNNHSALRHFVYEDLFGKVKFVESNEYNNPTNKVAIYVMGAMGVPEGERELWWQEGKDLVKKFVSAKRSAVQQNIWLVFKGTKM